MVQQQPKPYDESMVVGREFGGGYRNPPLASAGGNDVPPSSELSDDKGMAARREGNISVGAGKYSNS